MILQTNLPIFEQIFKEYEKLIKLGVLKNGEKLPSVRELGIELGVNPNTVSRAYDLLIKGGYVKSFEKKGIYVIYKNNNAKIKFNEVSKFVINLKNSGLDKEDLIKIINDVYGGDNLWLK